MEPYQSQLFGMTMFLIGCMFIGTAPAAWFLRNVRDARLGCGAFVATLVMMVVMMAASSTGNAPLVAVTGILFGACLGATLGVYSVAVTEGRRHAAEAVGLTLGLVGISTMSAAFIGMFSGFNWQGIGGIMFTLLLVLIAVSIVLVFVRMGRTQVLVYGGLASVFWFIYLIYDFNKIVHRYSEASWPAAAEIAMNVYLDMVNLFIQLLPIMVELLDALD